MHIISTLGLRGLFSSYTPMEYHVHTLGYAHLTLDTTALGDSWYMAVT
jgi:hypothetical protein